MKNKHLITNRKCIVTNQIIPKSSLIRIVKKQDGTIVVNSDLPGRGAYISKHAPNFEIIKQRKILNRVFKTNVTEARYDELITLLKGIQDGKKRSS